MTQIRTIVSINELIIDALGNFKDFDTKRSYMAISSSIPKVGESYKCKRLDYRLDYNDGELLLGKGPSLETFPDEYLKNDLDFYEIKTSPVQKVKKLAGDSNVFIVETLNSYYITRILNNVPDNNVHFAVLAVFTEGAPQTGNNIKCYRLVFCEKEIFYVTWYTETVQKIEYISGLYRMETMDGIVYVGFPLDYVLY